MAFMDVILSKGDTWKVILDSNTNESGTFVGWRIFEQLIVHLEQACEARINERSATCQFKKFHIPGTWD